MAQKTVIDSKEQQEETEGLAFLPRYILDEMVHWIKTLKAAGVSADKAAEVAGSFFNTAFSITASAMADSDLEGLDEEDYYAGDQDDEED